jgi:hypothetical protein
MMVRLFAMACALTTSTVFAQGDEPMPKPAPFPIEIVPRTTTVTVQPGGPFRWGTREVWQYYGVDSMGRWRPLVVREPFSTSYFYLYNGQQYYWPTTRPLDFMPYAD